MNTLCVFCGSSSGTDPAYEEGARSLGRALVRANVTLVYGGASVGLMGAVADSVLGAGGEAVGVIPEGLVHKEISHPGLTELHVVGSMHERKAMMAELSEGFITLPGGTGTMEEFFEVFTWAQLGEHDKPCGLLDVAGYFDPLVAFLDHMVERGFLKEHHRAMILHDTDPASLLDRFAHYEAPGSHRWTGERDTG